jgi:hypothetical protein
VAVPQRPVFVLRLRAEQGIDAARGVTLGMTSSPEEAQL